MEEMTKKQMFVQLQFCLLLLMCTLLPDLSSLIGVPDFSISVFCCKLVGVIGGGMALFAFHKSGAPLSPVFLGAAGGGIALALLSLIPSIPGWLGYIAIIALLVAVFTAKGNLNISWNKEGSQGAYIILIALLLHLYDGIGDNTLTGIAALIGFFLYYSGLGKLKGSLDKEGIQGISRLKIAIILGIVAVLFGWIPLLGTVVAGIVLIIAFIFEFLGYGNLKQSAPLGAEGQAGAGKLRISMIIMIVAAIISIIPGLGDVIAGILSLVALWFVFKGWSMILFGLEKQ